MYIYMHIKCDVTFFLLLRPLGLIRPKKLVNSSYALTFNARNCTRTILYIILAINRKAILEKLNTNLMKKKLYENFTEKNKMHTICRAKFRTFSLTRKLAWQFSGVVSEEVISHHFKVIFDILRLSQPFVMTTDQLSDSLEAFPLQILSFSSDTCYLRMDSPFPIITYTNTQLLGKKYAKRK